MTTALKKTTSENPINITKKRTNNVILFYSSITQTNLIRFIWPTIYLCLTDRAILFQLNFLALFILQMRLFSYLSAEKYIFIYIYWPLSIKKRENRDGYRKCPRYRRTSCGGPLGPNFPHLLKFGLGRSEEREFYYRINHSAYIRWYLRNRWACKEQFLLFD